MKFGNCKLNFLLQASNFSSFPTNTATTTATASATTNSGTIKGQSFDATQCIVPVANNKCQEIKRENSQKYASFEILKISSQLINLIII